MFELVAFLSLLALVLGIGSLWDFLDTWSGRNPFVEAVLAVVGIGCASLLGALIGTGVTMLAVGQRHVRVGATIGCVAMWLLFIYFAIFFWWHRG